MQWEWLGNTGKRSKFQIPKSYCVPQRGARLLIPQYLAQAQKDENPIQEIGRTIDSIEVRMYWDQHKYELTTPLEKSTNVANINVVPRYRKFKMYCQKSEVVPETYSDHLFDDQAAAEVSDNESEV